MDGLDRGGELDRKCSGWMNDQRKLKPAGRKIIYCISLRLLKQARNHCSRCFGRCEEASDQEYENLEK